MIAKTTPFPAWLKPVEKYLAVERKMTEEPSQGASETQIGRFLEEAGVHSLYVDQQYVEFLRFVNGTDFDGLSFAGCPSSNPDDEFPHGLTFYNPPEDDVTGGDATYYGIQDDLRYRYLKSTIKYQVVDEALNVSDEFGTFGELVYHVFTNWLKSHADLLEEHQIGE